MSNQVDELAAAEEKGDVYVKECNCNERKDWRTGDRMPEGEFTHLHDCTYSFKRAALVPDAQINVYRRWGWNLPGARFTRLFAVEMERLVREHKLL